MEASTPQGSGVNNVMRDLCAGVFTGRVAYRHKLRNFFRDHFTPVAPVRALIPGYSASHSIALVSESCAVTRQGLFQSRNE